MSTPTPRLLNTMTRAFSLTSDSLGYFLGYAFVRAPRVCILSPWLSDIQVRFPLSNRVSQQRLRLSEAISQLPETEIQIAVRSGENHNEYVRERLPERVSFSELNDLHAKAIVTPEFVYLGSANLTYRGTQVNKELCEVVENQYGSVGEFLSEELDFTL